MTRFLGGAIVLMAMAACGPPASATYEGFATNACDALAVLARVDIAEVRFGGGSELGRALNEAVRSANLERASELAAAIRTELARGRESAAAAASWQPGATAMLHLDRVFAAQEAELQASLQRAARDPTAPDAYAAFQVAGGDNARASLREAAESVRAARPPGVLPYRCDDGQMTW